MASVGKRKWVHNGVDKEAWMVRYTDDRGKRRAKTFDLKKEADAFRRQVEREIEDGTHVAVSDSRTVAQAVREYLFDCDTKRRDGRIGFGHSKRLNGVCNTHIVPKLGHIILRDMTMTDVLNFYRDMTQEGLAASTCRLYVHYLAHIEKFARRRGWMKTQPVADAGDDLRGVKTPTIKTFSPDEVATILEACAGRRKWCRERSTAMMECIVNLAALCGLRMGEIIGLPHASVNIDQRTISIRQNMTAWKELKGPKTAAGNREVVIPKRMMAMIESWLAEFYMPNERGLLFTGPTGRPLGQSNVRRTWADILKSCSLPHRRFHALRHFHASWLVRNGMPVTDVSKMLGHSHFDMTLRRYAHGLMDRAQKVEAMDQISGLLPAPTTNAPHGPLTI